MAIPNFIISRYSNWKQKRMQRRQNLASLSPREQLAQAELNRIKTKGRKKKFSLAAAVLIILIIVIGAIWFIRSQFVSPFLKYKIGGIYEPYFSAFSGYVSSTVSSISGFLSNPEGYINNYFFPKTTQVTQPVMTFTSFVSITPPASEQSLYITPSSSASAQNLLFVAGNLANVPLGSNYPNKLKFNVTCAPGNEVCTNLTNLAGGELVQPSVIFPGNQLQQSAPVSVHCPTNNKALAKQLPVQTSVQIISDATNYTAASLLDLEYMNSTFYGELVSSSQAVLPIQEATVIPSQGPLEVTPNIGESEPLLSDQNVSVSITINNLGSGPFVVNNLTIYVPESFTTKKINYIPLQHPVLSTSQTEGYSLQGIDELNSLAFQCVSLGQTANDNLNIVQNFVFPTYGYIKCWPRDLNQESFLFQLSSFIMPNSSHFEMIPMLFQMSYNYTSTASLSFYVINDTTCTGS